MNGDTLEAWLDSGPVRRALQETAWVTTGDTVGLLEEIIRQVDSPPLGLLDEATETLLAQFARFTPDELGALRPDSGVGQVILMLLDCDVSPEDVRKAGFSQARIDWHVGRTPGNWRATALALARQGAPSEMIRTAVPTSVRHSQIETCLALHGLDYTWSRRPSPVVPGQVVVHLDLIRQALEQPDHYRALAARFGVDVTHIRNVMYRYRTGCFPIIEAILNAEAAA